MKHILWLRHFVPTCFHYHILDPYGHRNFQGIKTSKPLRKLAAAMILAIACMIARVMYRGIDLSQGVGGVFKYARSICDWT